MFTVCTLCQLFNEFLVVFSQWRNAHLFLSYVMSANHFTITPLVVFNKLSQLNPTKAPGPEGWLLFCFKECAEELSIPLSILFNKSMETSTLPDHWKEALVIPAFKKGDRTRVNNYHPISLTLPICKIMESIIKDSIQQHL